MPSSPYYFSPDAWERLAAAGVPVVAVLHVLYRTRTVRRHIGSVLQVAGQNQDGTWLTVALIEGTEDTYTVVGARWLDEAEIAAVRKMLGGNP